MLAIRLAHVSWFVYCYCANYIVNVCLSIYINDIIKLHFVSLMNLQSKLQLTVCLFDCCNNHGEIIH